MVWSHIHPTALHLSFLFLSGSILLYTIFSRLLKESCHLAEPPLATLIGILIGPAVSGIVEPQPWKFGDHVTKELARLTAGMQVFIVGIELPRNYCKRHWKSLGMVLGPVMLGGWFMCAVMIHLVLGASYSTALIIGACLTPTDPVLVATILEDPDAASDRIKNLLAAESGMNDGTSFPFLYLGIFLLMENSVAGVLKNFTSVTILYQCLASSIIGWVLGYGANRALRYAHMRGDVAERFVAPFPLALVTFCLGFSSTLGMDDFLLVFTAGIGYAHNGGAEEEAYRLNPIATSFISFALSLGTFVYFGVMIPWDSATDAPKMTPLRVLTFVALVLLLRRLPFIVALKRWIPDIKTYREALFCGHFGPMGVGALFLSIEARDKLEERCVPAEISSGPRDSYACEGVELVWPIICFTVLGSVVVHGLSMSAAKLVKVFMCRRQGKTKVNGSLPNGHAEDGTPEPYHDEENRIGEHTDGALI
ncbi:Cation/H+ exchanger [Aspergillus avenaceus]|uniref:Cation/H+ exchanger n=1 Tax=Aspergillus avenaceus TaxID=36643 RepID=A0A5N6U9K2_ASPAV|nr:Cation/H+ exchanger [Aspergillus avenaceus]